MLLQNKPYRKNKFQRFNRLLSLQMYHFSLAIYFMDVQPRLALPLLHDFWVEWFPSTYAVLQVHEFVSSQGVKNMKGMLKSRGVDQEHTGVNTMGKLFTGRVSATKWGNQRGPDPSAPDTRISLCAQHSE